MITPAFHGALDRGFNYAAKFAPIMNEYPKTSAATIGFAVPFVLIKGSQLLLKKFAPKFYNDYLPGIEKGAGYAVLAATTIYCATHPGTMSEIFNGVYPVYTPGTAAVVATTSATLLFDAHKKRDITDKFNNDKTNRFDYDDKPDLLERMFGI